MPCYYEHDRKLTFLDNIKNTIYDIKSNIYGQINDEHIRRSKILFRCRSVEGKPFDGQFFKRAVTNGFFNGF